MPFCAEIPTNGQTNAPTAFPPKWVHPFFPHQSSLSGPDLELALQYLRIAWGTKCDGKGEKGGRRKWGNVEGNIAGGHGRGRIVQGIEAELAPGNLPPIPQKHSPLPFLVACLSLFEKQRKNLAGGQLDADEQKAYNEALSWGRLRYVHILTARANLMAALSEAKVPFVLAESDAIWLRNPLPELFAKANLVEDADLVMPLNSPKGNPHLGAHFSVNFQIPPKANDLLSTRWWLL